MPAKKVLKQSAALKIKNHIDFNEIVNKMVVGVEPDVINEWLEAKYAAIDKNLVISKKDLQVFAEDYLDFYNEIQDDAFSSKEDDATLALQNAVQNTKSFRERKQEILDKEIDIKDMIIGLVVNIQARAEQVFDEIQSQPRNLRNDRVLIEWFNLLLTSLEKYEPILNGTTGAAVTQNNINIQIVDRQISAFHNVIREVLSQLDYDTSLLFMDLYTKEMNKVKEMSIEGAVPVEVRLEQTKEMKENIETALLT